MEDEEGSGQRKGNRRKRSPERAEHCREISPGGPRTPRLEPRKEDGERLLVCGVAGPDRGPTSKEIRPRGAKHPDGNDRGHQKVPFH